MPVMASIRRVGVVLLMLTACRGGDALFVPVPRLVPPLQATLDSLLVQEWEAEARYREAMAQFGEVAPWHSLARAQADRSAWLLRIYRSYPTFPPANPHAGDAEALTPADAPRTCAALLMMEEATAALYSRALALRPPHDVERILKRNRAETLSREVPTARRCA